MPSQRKRIGFLPSEEVHSIIDKLCSANEFSQSKVTGLLVEEALRSRGVLSESSSSKTSYKLDFFNDSFEQKHFYENNKSPSNSDSYTVNKELFSYDIKLMHEYIEFKYFKKIMKQNKDILGN
ncbi:MAG: hypothetical protein JJ848_007925 [Prochlorococcus marinus CUG1439]|uniref:hypothetical protein n=1 Tax=Prochlorococcus sp. MIT 1314 TaxID=3096220 RepID=UPI001B0F8ACA|nr:hypothetical protein [Prochlorococcus sp. MIT 1314]MCR8540263.1 hypothetical protein [Prochlorococcus marinus CUG1439]